MMAARGGVVGFNTGGLTNGPGHGLSDSIPANIDGVQEARLSAGEFVVPADVVSGIGNGSTDSGAMLLHQMMNNVRESRNGNKMEPREINPMRYLPR